MKLGLSVRLTTSGLVGATLVAGLLGAPLAHAADEDLRTVAQAASAKGYKVIEKLSADFDADGRTDVVAACKKDRAVFLCVFGKNKRGATLKTVSKSTGGNKFKSLAKENLVPASGAPFVLLEVYGDNPDEKTKRVRVYSLRGGGLRQVFTSVIFRPKNKSRRADWETDRDIVKYDDPRQGWYFLDLDNDGRKEIIVRKKPQIVTLKREDRDPARIITGVREAVYDWTGSPTKGKYVAREKGRLNSFIQPRKVSEVRASSAYIERKLEKKMKQDAIAKASMAAADGSDDIPSKEIDRTAFIITGADDDLDTAWIENEKGEGEGEWLEIELETKAPVRMIRVVAGCAKDRKTFRSHNVPVKFELHFGGVRALVDREIPRRPVPPILGIMDLPVKGKKFAKQTLIFFDGRTDADVVRLTLQESRRLGRGNRTCISEVSVH